MTNLRANALLAACLAAGALFQAAPAQAQSYTRDDIRMIEQEYSRATNGRAISDAQLEYYLGRRQEGWSMDQIRRDIAGTGRNSGWRPGAGYVAREVICTSVNNRYRECQIPFRGTAMVNQQLSRTACVEGSTWGQKPGSVWVNRGCRAVFGVVRTGRRNNNPNAAFNRDPNYGVTCASTSGGRQVCNWDARYGTPVLVQQLSNSRCVEGRDWGYDRGGQLWVNSGCRARFGYQGMPATSGVWNRDPNYAVTCTSVDGRRSVCDWDNRYGQPRIIQQISSSACIEGRDWGYDTRGGLWVNSGCRARFGYR